MRYSQKSMVASAKRDSRPDPQGRRAWAVFACLLLSATSGRAAITIDGVADKKVYADRVSFTVRSEAGFDYTADIERPPSGGGRSHGGQRAGILRAECAQGEKVLANRREPAGPLHRPGERPGQLRVGPAALDPLPDDRLRRRGVRGRPARDRHACPVPHRPGNPRHRPSRGCVGSSRRRQRRRHGRRLREITRCSFCAASDRSFCRPPASRVPSPTPRDSLAGNSQEDRD